VEFEDKQIGEALNTWRDSLDQQAERPDWFWSRQHARVMSDVKRPRRRTPVLAWAGIAATVALAISLMLPHSKPNAVMALPVAANAQISDHDLMISLERTMNEGVPSSLAPAGLLAQEMNQAYTKVQAQKSKEKKYEN